MTWKKIQITCWTVFFIIGCFLWSPHLFVAEVEKAETDKDKAKKPSVIVQNKTVPTN